MCEQINPEALFPIEPEVHELVLRSRHTLENQLCYDGSTTQDGEISSDIHTLIVFAHKGDFHTRTLVPVLEVTGPSPPITRTL